MLWSGSSPLSVVRDGMWGFLLFAGVAWLAIAWSVLRLEPTDIVQVAGPVVLFGALTEAVRALAGTRTWWLNAGMAALFAATGVIMLADGGSSWTTPAALVGWYLMVRGAADIAISMLTRESDRIWGLLMVVGVAEVGLGFFAASSFARTAEMVIVVLGGAALARAVADLVASLRLREASVMSRAERLLELPPERAIGVAGYAAGMTDFESGSQERAGRPRHRAAARSSAAGMADLSGPGSAMSAQGAQARALGSDAGGSHSWGEPIGSVTAGSSSAGSGSAASSSAGSGSATSGSSVSGSSVSGSSVSGSAGGGSGGSGSASWNESAGASESWGKNSGSGGGAGTGSFHDEVLRTTADLDAMLALAGVTGAAVPGAAARAARDELVEVPDTAEGAELPSAAETAAAAAAQRSAEQRKAAAEDRALPLLDPAARAAEAASPGIEDTSIIARRMVD